MEGGAVWVSGGNTLLSGCDFDDCRSSGFGGALSQELGDLLLKDCAFASCTGTIGGAVVFAGLNIVVLQSSFVGCTARDLGGSLTVGENACARTFWLTLPLRPPLLKHCCL